MLCGMNGSLRRSITYCWYRHGMPKCACTMCLSMRAAPPTRTRPLYSTRAGVLFRAHACVCLCVSKGESVRPRQRERTIERGRQRERGRASTSERARESERERERHRERRGGGERERTDGGRRRLRITALPLRSAMTYLTRCFCTVLCRMIITIELSVMRAGCDISAAQE